MWRRSTTRIATARITTRNSARGCFLAVRDLFSSLTASFFAHGDFVPKPNQVAVRIVQFSAVSPEMPLRLVKKFDALSEELAMRAIDVADLNRERAFFAGQRSLRILKENGEIVVVLNGRKAGRQILELDLESEVFHVPIAGCGAVGHRKGHMVELHASSSPGLHPISSPATLHGRKMRVSSIMEFPRGPSDANVSPSFSSRRPACRQELC